MITAVKGQRVMQTCTACGKEVERFLSQTARSRQPFCSMRCRASYQGKERAASGTWVPPVKPKRGEEKPCGNCGKPVYRAPGYPSDQTRYCSKACHDQAQAIHSVEKPCEQCGTIMVLHPSTAKTRRFCTWACLQAHRSVHADGRTINGRPVLVNAAGYITIYMPDHPAAGKIDGRVLEHRIVMERKLGRYLRTDEQVHHLDGVKTHNVEDNLEILSPAAHTRKTVERTMAKHASIEDELAEYRRRFGPL